MLCEEMTHKEILQTIMEMLSSVREINRRVEELKWVIKQKLFASSEAKKKILGRVESLGATRMKIIYSIHDLRQRAEIALEKKDGCLQLDSLYRGLRSL